MLCLVSTCFQRDEFYVKVRLDQRLLQVFSGRLILKWRFACRRLVWYAPGSAPVGKESITGQKGKLNCDALKQRLLLNLQGLWGFDDPSDLIRIGQRDPGLLSHPPSLDSHCLQAVLEEGSDFESIGFFQQRTSPTKGLR